MPRVHRGPIAAMRPHKSFLGAADIEHLCPFRVRIVHIIIYEAGERPMGRKLDDPLTVMRHEMRRWDRDTKTYTDEWLPAPKEWILNPGIQNVLNFRYGFDTTLWEGHELDLFIDVCKSPKGGLTYGVRICPSELDQGLTHEQIHAHLMSHIRYQPPTPAKVFEGIDDETETETETDDETPRTRYDAGADWAR
jgi:hypothetical protein